MLRLCLVLSAILMNAALLAASAKAQVAGEWTRCVAFDKGQQWNIVHAQDFDQHCFQLARKCTGNPNVKVTFYGNPVIINAPYQRCMLF